MIELRQKFPGGQYWFVRELEAFFNDSLLTSRTCIVRNQKEKEMLDGYGLVFGLNPNVVVGEHTLAPTSDDPYLFLWVVSVEELS